MGAISWIVDTLLFEEAVAAAEEEQNQRRQQAAREDIDDNEDEDDDQNEQVSRDFRHEQRASAVGKWKALRNPVTHLYSIVC